MLPFVACRPTYGQTTPRTKIRPPTNANGGLPPTLCSTSSARPATGLPGAGGEGGAAETGAVDAEAAGAARQSTAAASTVERRALRTGRSYASGPTRDVRGVIRPSRLAISTTPAIPASEPTISSGACQPQFSRLENASELFSEWAAKHGYSEPVRR